MLTGTTENFLFTTHHLSITTRIRSLAAGSKKKYSTTLEIL